MSDVNNATTIARASAALADDIGTADMPDALRHIAEQGPRTYAEQIIAHALTHAADVIEELTAELAVTARNLEQLRAARPIIQPSDDETAPFMLGLDALRGSDFYATAEEADALADWLDHMVGGSHDLATEIRALTGGVAP